MCVRWGGGRGGRGVRITACFTAAASHFVKAAAGEVKGRSDLALVR